MSVKPGLMQWIVECDHAGCTRTYTGLYATCARSLLDADEHGWRTRYDGTAYCPTHKHDHDHDNR